MRFIIKIFCCFTATLITSCGILQQAPQSTQAVPNATIGEVIISESTVNRVVDVDSITLPNCNGSSELTVSRTLTKEIDGEPLIPEIPIDRLGFAVQIPELRASVLGFMEMSEVTNITDSIEVEMNAAPGTTVTYEIEWVEISSVGVIELIAANDRYFHEFSVPSSLDARIRQPVQEPCEIAEATQQP